MLLCPMIRSGERCALLFSLRIRGTLLGDISVFLLSYFSVKNIPGMKGPNLAGSRWDIARRTGVVHHAVLCPVLGNAPDAPLGPAPRALAHSQSASIRSTKKLSEALLSLEMPPRYRSLGSYELNGSKVADCTGSCDTRSLWVVVST